MNPISNPNIQVSFEYMAHTTITTMTHKQLWSCLNPKCLELGYGRSKSNAFMMPDGREDFLCECGTTRNFCKYDRENKEPIENLQTKMKDRVKEELNRYSNFYNKYYGVDVTLRQEHVSSLWNKIFFMSDVDFTLELIKSKKENNYVIEGSVNV
jgi:hypothetical protein